MKKLLALILSLSIGTPMAVFATTYIVQPGDTLFEIAESYGTTVPALAESNDIINPNLIFPGQELEVGNPLGAQIPTVVALYTDSLASRITDSATSFTLVRGTDLQDRSLSGFYGFVIDEGSSIQEFMTANCVATACTIVARGIDVVDGKTEVTALKQEHRRGAVTKITNFPQLAILSRILNGLESASSTFRFGDGTTTSTLYKVIKADNGTANLPFIRYNEITAKWQFSDDGLSSVNFSTGTASGLSASSTRAIVITDSQIAVVASSSAFLFDGTGALGLSGMVPTSTIFNGANNVFNGITTHNGATYVTTPAVGSTSGLAANDIALAQSVSMNIATGTAQVAITAGQALWASATSSQIMVANSSVASSTYQFIGIATANAAAAATVTYTKFGGINCQQSGLTAGTHYFLNGTAGQINTTPGTFSARVGIATSATCIQVMSPKFVANGSILIAPTGSTTTNIGFYPAHIEIRGGCVAAGAGMGFSIGDENNTSVYRGYNGTNEVGGASPTTAFNLYCNGVTATVGTVSARSAIGFTINVSSASGVPITLQYSASSE